MPTRAVSMYGYLAAAALIQAIRSGKPGVAQVLPADVVKCLGTIRRAHAVDLDDDEAQLRQRLGAVERRELLRDKRVLWAGIDVLDDRILLGRHRHVVGRQMTP